MNELIKLTHTTIGDDTVQTINARELHAFLEVGKDFSSWIKDRIDQYSFENNKDYLLTKIGEQLPSGTKYKNEYHLSLDMAKELSMVERNDKGKEARQYFIECERKAKSNVTDPMKALSDPTIMRGLLLTYTEKVITLENKVSELAPKAGALDRIAGKTEGSVCLRIAAKLLQMQEKQFLQFANTKGFIFRNHFSKIWQGYSEKAKAGLVELKLTTIERDDGSIKMVEQVLITRSGIAKLAELMERERV
jgi:phage anti-repressor protein/phage antirepressor YoqD-like protein